MTTHPQTGATGMPVRMPLVRARPWITDGVWCAHESHHAVAALAQQLPLNGWWRFTADGSERLDRGSWPDISAFMSDLDDRAVVPAGIEASPPTVAEDVDHITAEQIHEQRVYITMPDGSVHAANWAIVATFDGPATLTWRIAAPGERGPAMLLGVDHKGRPRVAVACLVEEWEEES